MNQKVIFFDGFCNLCNRWVQFVIKKDKHKKFRFASLQSTTAQKLLSHYPSLQEADSIIYIDGKNSYIKSGAAIMILRELGGIYKAALILRIFPWRWADAIYDFIAARRYRLFGRQNECMVPDKAVSDRFLS